jgi:hypothetical protein
METVTEKGRGEAHTLQVRQALANPLPPMRVHGPTLILHRMNFGALCHWAMSLPAT